jgi:hypothetical protein
VATARSANTATRFNSSGLIEIINANLPRYNFNPSTLLCQGQLIEEARTNLFLNSLIDGTNLATQSVTLSAVAYTLSFYGSGSVDITGGHTATVSGVGDFPNRKTYTFTPTAGSSTFTVTGDVKFAQLEAGAFATSFIPTAATSVLRNADVVSMTGTNFSNWYNASEGSFAVLSLMTNAAGTSTPTAIMVRDSTSANRIQLRHQSTNYNFLVQNASVPQASFSTPYVLNSQENAVLSYKTNSFISALNGQIVGTDFTGTVPSVDRMDIGSFGGANYINGHIAKILYWPMQLTSNEVRAF